MAQMKAKASFPHSWDRLIETSIDVDQTSEVLKTSEVSDMACQMW